MTRVVMMDLLCTCHTCCPQGLSGSDVENVGYVIPTPVVHHFLNDFINNGHFTGFPSLGIQWQRMESEALRKAYSMAPGQKGEHK
jgi:S1-C subfamily serine protease